MKSIKHFFALSASLFMLILMTDTANAQSPASASISSDFKITLSGSDVQKFYVLDASSFSFKDEAEAVKYCSYVRDNLVRFEYLDKSDEVKIEIYPEYLSPANSWSLTQWNDYFTERADLYSQTLDKFHK